MKSTTDLSKLLDSVNHKSYGAYKALAGQYAFNQYTLCIDHVQGDPFASPSKLRVIVERNVNMIPTTLYDAEYKRIAVQDHINRLFEKNVFQYAGRVAGSGGSGRIRISHCGQQILERSAVQLSSHRLEVRFEVGFPARGRTILSDELKKILFDFLPQIVRHSLLYKNINQEALLSVSKLAEDQYFIRQELKRQNLVAFVANGAVLPRESGVSDKPMKNGIPFTSPETLSVTMNLPNRGPLTGMGIQKGITLIVGGGFHGKSTLLKSLEMGVYNHIAGDGREYVITDESAVKIRAEDGRSIQQTDISLFINNLPNGKDTHRFCTENASGSTSQAANVMEGIEAGTSLLLIDEDTSATNFMIRDEIMQQLVTRDKEPITPFIERAAFLYRKYGVSTILVVGSSGTYFAVADTVIQMDCYKPKNITQQAKELANRLPSIPGNAAADNRSFCRTLCRGMVPKSDRGVKVKSRGTDALSINKEEIDLRYLEQLVDSEQTAALGYLMKYAEENLTDNRRTLPEVADLLYQKIQTDGLLSIISGSYCPDFLALPRKQEWMSCVNRCRNLKITTK